MEYKNSTIQKIVCVLPSLLQVIWDKKLSGVKNKKYIKKKTFKTTMATKKKSKNLFEAIAQKTSIKNCTCVIQILFSILLSKI